MKTEKTDEEKAAETFALATKNIEAGGKALKQKVASKELEMQQIVDSAPPEHKQAAQHALNQYKIIIAKVKSRELSKEEAEKQLRALLI
jgi:hypothetical protein